MYYVNPNIKSLYRTSYNESRKQFLRLDMNENPVGLPTEFFEKFIDNIRPEYVAMYPEMSPLIDKLARYLECQPSNICLTNGSDDAIRLLFQVFGEPGKKVVSVSPSFEMYSVYSNMYGLVHEPVTYDDDFQVNLDQVMNSIDHDTSIVVLLNPNSPIGTAWSETEVRAIIEKAQKNNAIVAIDEAYYYFSSSTFVHYVDKYDNVMLFRTFSKMLSIAGARIGYIYSNSHLIKEAKKASSTYAVNYFAVEIAETILDNPQIIEELMDKEREGREYLLAQLENHGYEYHFNNGNYLLIKTNKHPQYLFDELKRRKILIKVYNNPILSDWIRVTTANKEIMQIFWGSFKEVDHN
ncbi:histidinol-phosphate transaminase [Paenibacillus polygoni]|uniref:Histidinol-phosphate transaminase n=1 Tax=Paenibacillus polygoni TaxID=3050112 RepID=A0ABY8X357_9BACL|nr:histidinol-phosphate transaminase [Paenibacillus polygoni]WIV18897.1 histidinol-phosphate transaminase [Paenibacillus polygoni]